MNMVFEFLLFVLLVPPVGIYMLISRYPDFTVFRHSTIRF